MTSLQQKLNQLNLTTMSEHLDETLADAASKNLSAAEAFEALLDRELEARQTRSIDRRFRLSRLQAKHSIDSFHFNHHKTRLQCKSRILRLLDLGFLEKGTAVVLIGNPGVGKTFLATAIADRLVENSEIILLGGESLRKANKGPAPTE